MLYKFLYFFHEQLNFFNVLRYPSFRIIISALTAGLICFILYPYFIKKLTLLSFGQEIRDDGPQSHLKKQGTPTMGGLLILIAIIFSCLLWGDLSHMGLWLLIFTTTGFGIIGFIDDYRKIARANSKGLSAKTKFLSQILIALIVLLIYSYNFSSMPASTLISFPFVAVNKFSFYLPWYLYIIFGVIVITGTSNAVNLTDGLDGLAIGPVITSAFVFLILSYLAGTTIQDFNFADYLKIPRVDGAAELAIFCGAVIGASIGFLWFNTYPAHIFMGDVGSLALGASLGLLAVLTKTEFTSIILHGIFLFETLSVMAQVISYKLFKKRIFKMAPIHHHFELLGWAEPKITVRFWIISGLLALITLISIKLR